MAKIFPNVMIYKPTDYEVKQTLRRININKTIARHIIIKVLNTNNKKQKLQAWVGKETLHTEEQR